MRKMLNKYKCKCLIAPRTSGITVIIEHMGTEVVEAEVRNKQAR